MTAPTSEHELTRQLMRRAGAAQDDTAAVVLAVEHALQQLQHHLSRWFGADGAQAILSRALERARDGHRVLAGAHVVLGDGPRLTASTDTATAIVGAEATDGLTAWIGAVVAVLTPVIGADMAQRVVHQAWSDEAGAAPGVDRQTNTTRKLPT